MNRPFFIVGAGGHAREALMILRAVQGAEPGSWDFIGFLADRAPAGSLLDRLGARHLGHPDAAGQAVPPGSSFLVGIGDGATRQRLQDSLQHRGFMPTTLIHPRATVGPDVSIGAGSLLFPNCVITVNARIGRGASINLNSSVGHDARWGDFVSVTQNVAISGNVTIGDRATVYSAACIKQGVTVGRDATVGACAFVNRDVPDATTVVGAPARPIRVAG